MGKYDDVERHLITHIDEMFPFAFMDLPRDWDKISEMMTHIPIECDRVLSMEELLNFYD